MYSIQILGISKKIIENLEMSKGDGEGMQRISCAHVTSRAARNKLIFRKRH